MFPESSTDLLQTKEYVEQRTTLHTQCPCSCAKRTEIQEAKESLDVPAHSIFLAVNGIGAVSKQGFR